MGLEMSLGHMEKRKGKGKGRQGRGDGGGEVGEERLIRGK